MPKDLQHIEKSKQQTKKKECAYKSTQKLLPADVVFVKGVHFVAEK